MVGLLDCVDWFAQLCLDSKEVDLWCRGMDGMVGPGRWEWALVGDTSACVLLDENGHRPPFLCHILGKTLDFWDSKDHLKAKEKASCYVEHVVELRR